MDEVTVGSGGLCGSVYLNRKFETLVREKIGSKLDLLAKLESMNALHEVSISVCLFKTAGVANL